MSAKIHSGDFLSAWPQHSSPTTAAATAAGLFRRFLLLFQELCKIETWIGPPPGATGTRLDLTSRLLEEMLGHRPEVLWPTTFSLSFLSIISISLRSWGPSDLVHTITWLLNGRCSLKTPSTPSLSMRLYQRSSCAQSWRYIWVLSVRWAFPLEKHSARPSMWTLSTFANFNMHTVSGWEQSKRKKWSHRLSQQGAPPPVCMSLEMTGWN